MSTRSLGLSETLHAYLLDVAVRETPVQRELRRLTAERFDAEMQIAPEQGQFFAFLVRALGVKRALEVGTFTGYSALAVALALPEDGTLDCCDVSEEFTAVARDVWDKAGVSAKIALHLGDARQTLDRFLAEGRGGTYDFAFVDADKLGYPRYFEQLLALLRPGGVMAFDNTLWSGRIADPEARDEETEAIRRLNRSVMEHPDLTGCLVPVADGVTLAIKHRASGGSAGV